MGLLDWFKTWADRVSATDNTPLISFDALGKGEARFSFARERFLGIKTLQAIGSLKRQLLEAMSHANLAPPNVDRKRIAALTSSVSSTVSQGVNSAMSKLQ